VSNDANPAYAGPTLSGAGVVYAFYAVTAAAVGAPPAFAITVSGPAAVDGGSQSTYSAQEADVNGFPVLGATFTFRLDTPALGTIDANTGILTTAVAANVRGNVVAIDTLFSSRSGTLAVQSFSGRPASGADSLAYTGTVSRTIANAAISSGSPVTQTESGRVTQSVNVAAATAPGQFVLTTDEIDAFPLRSLETKTTATIAYEAAGSRANVRLLRSQATDSNNAVFASTYTPASGLLTVLPETTGQFGPNDASVAYAETDPGVNVGAAGAQITTQRTVHADGSYAETTTNDDGSVNIATVKSDLTAAYVLIGGAFRVTVDPVVPATATANPFIPVNIARANGTGGFLPPQTLRVPVWYPSAALFSESDVITQGSAFDASCTVPSRFGGTATKVQQSVRRFDPLFGTVEIFTSTSYDVQGVGTACLVLADSVTTNYDYSEQEGFVLAVAFPVLTTTYAETLSLTSANVAGQPAGTRTASGVRAVTAVSAAFAREGFLHAVRLDRVKQTMRGVRRARAAQGRAR
ncbi:MAG: hypothetical protein ABR591_12215, partial [Candidatus Velthaea sp.]